MDHHHNWYKLWPYFWLQLLHGCRWHTSNDYIAIHHVLVTNFPFSLKKAPLELDWTELKKAKFAQARPDYTHNHIMCINKSIYFRFIIALLSKNMFSIDTTVIPIINRFFSTSTWPYCTQMQSWSLVVASWVNEQA